MGASFEDSLAVTLAAMSAGVAHIYQAALADGVWAGYADFLIRVERPSVLGAYSYEVVDTKLKRSPAPAHVLQLAVYSDLLARVQGVLPESIHIVLGDGRRKSLRLADYIHYARHLRRRLEDFVADPPSTRPVPVPACDLCRWREHCRAEWDTSDSLCLVAGIRRDQQSKLEAAGITTIAELTHRERSVPGLSCETFRRLHDQARHQHRRRCGGAPTFELCQNVEPGKGLSGLPRPAACCLRGAVGTPSTISESRC